MWRMVWEKDTNFIVMLTSVMERGKVVHTKHVMYMNIEITESLSIQVMILQYNILY